MARFNANITKIALAVIPINFPFDIVCLFAVACALESTVCRQQSSARACKVIYGFGARLRAATGRLLGGHTQLASTQLHALNALDARKHIASDSNCLESVKVDSECKSSLEVSAILERQDDVVQANIEAAFAVGILNLRTTRLTTRNVICNRH